MKLTGHTILVTGGTSGIGLAFAEHFHRLGNSVIICGRRKDRLAEIQKRLSGLHTKVCDVSRAEDRRELFQWVMDNHPQMDVLINNAGMQLAADLTQEIDLGAVDRELQTNLVAPMHLSSLFAAHLATKKDAYLINVSSGLAFVPIAFMPIYCASKAAIHSFTLSLRYQLRKSGIKVIEVIPPSVDSELGHERRADKSQTHGGMPIAAFIQEAMEGLGTDALEVPVGQAKGLSSKRETLFDMLNPA